MNTVFRHLLRVYGPTYAWFWGIMGVIITALSVSFQVFGHWSLDEKRSSVWETISAQAPKWFLMVMGILFVTINLPVLIANGFTRRTFFRGAMLFSVVVSVAFALLALSGFGIEMAVYHANGMMDELKAPYPMQSFGDAAEFVTKTVLDELAFMLSGSLIALCYVRLRVWWAIVLTPFAALPMGSLAVPFKYMPLSVLVLAVLAVLVWMLLRTIPVRPKKA